MDLDQVGQIHSDWKVKLRLAITKQEQMDAAGIANDRACEFGKWLHGEAKAKHGRLASYAQCVAKHADFHKEAAKVAQAINAKNYADAKSMLGANTPYALASMEVTVAIGLLKKEAGL
jgi:hypothetical protein